ncbi:MAG: hypothetical protein Q7U16_14770 [Agitococcus sp.]|nr:hypothetical protein [Agitococcus sp.]
MPMAKKLERLLLDIQTDRAREATNTLIQVRRVTFPGRGLLDIYYREDNCHIEEAYFQYEDHREKLNEEELGSLSVTY